MPQTPPGQAHHCQRTQIPEAEALFSSSAHQHRYRSKTGLADGPGEVGRRDGEAGRAEVGFLQPFDNSIITVGRERLAQVSE